MMVTKCKCLGLDINLLHRLVTCSDAGREQQRPWWAAAGQYLPDQQNWRPHEPGGIGPSSPEGVNQDMIALFILSDETQQQQA